MNPQTLSPFEQLGLSTTALAAYPTTTIGVSFCGVSIPQTATAGRTIHTPPAVARLAGRVFTFRHVHLLEPA